jgi:hypothetical protein
MSKRIFEIVQDINGRVGFHWDDEDKHELAELIVRECASLFPHQFTDEQRQRRIDRTICKHFGVEE